MSNARFGLRVRSGLVSTITEGSRGYGFVLNDVPNALGAFSLRKLNVNYSGSAIRVRRSSDNAESDIGFINNSLDVTTLTNFVGVSSGFITKWYDQSGNNYDLLQNSSTNQPRIVSNGTIDTISGQPSTYWIKGQPYRLVNSTISSSQPITIFIVSKLIASSGINAAIIFDNYNNVPFAMYHSGNNESPNFSLISLAGFNFNYGLSTTNLQLITELRNFGSSVGRINSTQIISGNIGSNSLSGLSVGNLRGNPSPVASNYEFAGYLSEIIFYNSSQTNNFNTIESNIRTFYNIS